MQRRIIVYKRGNFADFEGLRKLLGGPLLAQDGHLMVLLKLVHGRLLSLLLYKNKELTHDIKNCLAKGLLVYSLPLNSGMNNRRSNEVLSVTMSYRKENPLPQ